MLLANCTVAEQTLKHFPALSLLRRHPTPPPKHFEPLLRAAAAVGLSIDPSTSKVGGWHGCQRWGVLLLFASLLPRSCPIVAACLLAVSLTMAVCTFDHGRLCI